MECVRCFSPNDQHRRFCGQCGAALIALCPRCGFFNRVVDRFCGGCGDALAAGAGAHAPAERAGAPATPPPVPRQASQPAAAPRRAGPPPAPAPPPREAAPPAAHREAAAPGGNGDLLSKQDLTELLRPPAAPAAAPLPQKVSQDDLDKLFAK